MDMSLSKLPGTRKSSVLQSMESQRVRHDSNGTTAAALLPRWCSDRVHLPMQEIQEIQD